MSSSASRILAIKATFDGERIILPEDLHGARPGNAIVIFENTDNADDPTIWLEIQARCFAEAWDNPEDEIYDRL